MTLLNKLKLAAVAVLFTLLAAGGVGVGPWRANETAAAPVPKAKDDGLIWTHDGKGTLTALTPDGKPAKEVKLPDGTQFLGLTPDGTRLMFAGKKGKASADADELTLHVGPVDDSGTGTDTGLGWQPNDNFVPSPDGKRVVRSRLDDIGRAAGGKVSPPAYSHVLFDLAAKKETKIDLPADHQVLAWTADGKGWRVLQYNLGADPVLPNYRWLTTPADDKPDLKPLCDTYSFFWLDPHPDGKTLVGVGHDFRGAKPATFALLRLAGGKAEEVASLDAAALTALRVSPDGTRVAVLKYTFDAKSGALNGAELVVRAADGTGDEKSLPLPDAGPTTGLLGWFPTTPPAAPEPKAKPPAREPVTAPAPKVQENTMGLTASVVPEQKEIMLGEPTFLAFVVENPTEQSWTFEEGGDYRNRLGRPESFAVEVTGPDGKTVPQPDAGMSFGGISTVVKLPAGGKHSFSLFLPHWATFEKPGEYTITVRRKLTLVPPAPADGEKVKPAEATLSAAAKITVVAADAKRMGTLISALAGSMLDRNSADCERATQMTLAIRDERVIPHFIELGKLPHPSPRFAACDGLKRFKTDEAFAALRTLAATTGADLRGSATTRELEESSADGVRHGAIAALAKCGHPDALPLVWKAIADPYYGVRLTALHAAYESKSAEARKVIAALTTDANDTVRTEAKQYADLLAKEKR